MAKLLIRTVSVRVVLLVYVLRPPPYRCGVRFDGAAGVWSVAVYLGEEGIVIP